MKMPIKHILCSILTFLLVLSAQGQNKTVVDIELDRYEALCEICLEMKERISTGEQVSKHEAQALIGSFVSLNRKIKIYELTMTPSQKRRFEGIGIWFSTGTKPLSLSPGPSIRPVKASFNRLAYKTDEMGLSCVRTEQTRPPLPGKTLSVHILAGVSLPDPSYGLMAGVQYGKWGGYLNFKSNFIFKTPSYSCTSDGIMEDGTAFWPGGSRRQGNLIASAGGIYEVKDWVCVYAGAGYGYRKLFWDDIDGNWAEVSDWSVAGAAVEVGAIFSWRHLAFSLGVSTVAFRTASLSLGVGVAF